MKKQIFKSNQKTYKNNGQISLIIKTQFMSHCNQEVIGMNMILFGINFKTSVSNQWYQIAKIQKIFIK